MIDALADDNKVFESLESAVVGRSFPFRERLTIESANILSTALENVYVLFDESVDAIRHCYENGWIHRALARLGTETWYSVGVLPSRLHEK